MCKYPTVAEMGQPTRRVKIVCHNPTCTTLRKYLWTLADTEAMETCSTVNMEASNQRRDRTRKIPEKKWDKDREELTRQNECAIWLKS